MFEDIFSENPDHMGEGWVVGVGVPGWVGLPSPVQRQPPSEREEGIKPESKDGYDVQLSQMRILTISQIRITFSTRPVMGPHCKIFYLKINIWQATVSDIGNLF